MTTGEVGPADGPEKTLDYTTLKGLRAHQRAALDKIEAYFASGAQKSALVQHPTGTGKTGIMAIISTRRARDLPVLVVCPSAALIEQLMRQFGGADRNFWAKIKAPAEWAPEMRLHLLPSTLDEVVEKIETRNGKRAVVFSTIQAVQQIDDDGRIGKIKNLFGTVLFDEGHREPATSWAKVVRDFNAPTILFSATPFRNDLKIFNVDPTHIAFVSFQDAVRKHLIRDVRIVETKLANTPRTFARQVIALRDALIQEGHFPVTDKVIVRAASEENVRALYDAFRLELADRPETVLALHYRFHKTGHGNHVQRSQVPEDLHSLPYKFLIHQFMLTEGIDDPSCTMLALYDAFSTERQLIQQAGRLTRHPDRLGTEVNPAIVFAREGDGVAASWGRFGEFDRVCREAKGPPIRNDGQVLKDLLNALPVSDYIEKKFRSRFNPEGPDVEDELLLPLSCIVFKVETKFDLDEFSLHVASELFEQDRFEERLLNFADDHGRAHLSMRLCQSPFLKDTLFQSPQLELTAYVQRGSYLFFYDSAGLWMDEARSVGRRLSPSPLQSLLPESDDTFITSVTLKNSDIGPSSTRSKSLGARSLLDSGAFMGEHLHIVTRAVGRSGAKRRALGFTRSRVREGEGAEATLKVFAQWTAQIAKEIRRMKPGSPFFDRFAAAIEPPHTIVPTHILLDLNEFADQFKDENGKLAEVNADSVASDITLSDEPNAEFPYRFPLVINDEKITVHMRWDPEKRKFQIKSDEISEFKTSGDRKPVTLTKRINQKQPFRIILQGSKTVYAFGGFYAIDLKLGSQTGLGSLLLKLVTPVKGLKGCTSEKGDLKGRAATWPADSVFGVVDRELKFGEEPGTFGRRFANLVCEDLGPEAADFIGVDEGGGLHGRAALIVVKWKPFAKPKKKEDQQKDPEERDAGVSVSALYDVCAQALKSLAYMKPDSQALPGGDNSTRYDEDWSLEGGLVKRRRSGPKSIDFRLMFARVRSDPNAQREMWLVLGGHILSAAKLKTEFDAKEPKAHVLQWFHLLLSVYSACQSVGVRLRVFSG